ncbi:hypothetical protein [Ferruginibacter profundus]
MCTTGTLYTSLAMIANRYRPCVYNPNVPMDSRTRGGARNSFYAAHPSVVATSTYFMASVYTHYHPNMKHKWVLYTVARAGAANTGLLRLAAKLSLVPNFKDGASGFTAYYKLGKN